MYLAALRKRTNHTILMRMPIPKTPPMEINVISTELGPSEASVIPCDSSGTKGVGVTGGKGGSDGGSGDGAGIRQRGRGWGDVTGAAGCGRRRGPQEVRGGVQRREGGRRRQRAGEGRR